MRKKLSLLYQASLQRAQTAAKTLISCLQWIVPTGISTQFSHINENKLFREAQEEHVFYKPIEGLEKKLDDLRSRKKAEGSSYELLRGLGIFAGAGVYAIGSTYVTYQNAFITHTKVQKSIDDNPLHFLIASAVTYTLLTIFSAVKKQRFQEHCKEELSDFVEKQTNDEQQYYYLAQEYQFKDAEYRDPDPQQEPTKEVKQKPTKPRNRITPYISGPLPNTFNEELWKKFEHDFKKYPH